MPEALKFQSFKYNLRSIQFSLLTHNCYRNAPYVGMLTIWLNDYPMLKFAVIGFMFLTVLVSKDP